MNRNIKLTIEYDGTHYKGWQVQANDQRTIQGEIKRAGEKIFGQKINLIGSGRTDAGVHALGQVAHFHTTSKLPCETIKKALNANLPINIGILEALDVKSDFHAQFNAKRKTYCYTILNREERAPLLANYSCHYRYKLNLALMRIEAKVLIGEKDFKSFQSSDPSRKRENTVRTVKMIQIRKKGDLITIDIEANGFLYKMVRNIVGTLLEIGAGKRPKGAMKEILRKKDRNCAGATAKPQGLCLLKVEY